MFTILKNSSPNTKIAISYLVSGTLCMTAFYLSRQWARDNRETSLQKKQAIYDEFIQTKYKKDRSNRYELGFMMRDPIVGIIGGTGLDQDSSLLKNKRSVDLLETPYGWASDRQAVAGQIEGVQVFVLSRHGKKHDVNPSHVNYRANLWTLVKQLGCTHLLVTSACGSLKKEIEPGHIGVLAQYIDRTSNYRDRSFYKVCHIEQRDPINKTMRQFIEEECLKNQLLVHKDLTCVTVEGPRFSTFAESNLFRSWGCDIVNMTSVPEVSLASELGVFYGCILLVTDYDCWMDDENVSADLVVERMKLLGERARKIIPGIIRRIREYDWTEEIETNKKKVIASIMAE